MVTGTPAFFDGPQGVQRLAPLAQRLHVDFATDARFDNPRAVQIRLPGFDLDALRRSGAGSATSTPTVRRAPTGFARWSTTPTSRRLASAVAGELGGKVGVAPRVFLKKLVGDVLDRVDQFPDFDPRQHYALTHGRDRADASRSARPRRAERSTTSSCDR